MSLGKEFKISVGKKAEISEVKRVSAKDLKLPGKDFRAS